MSGKWLVSKRTNPLTLSPSTALRMHLSKGAPRWQRPHASCTNPLTIVFCVYILECADGFYYVGHSDNLEERLQQHQSGALGGYTANRRPVRLAYSQDFPTRDQAFLAERRVKGWSRKKKEALMRGDWGELRRLARGRHPSTSAS